MKSLSRYKKSVLLRDFCTSTSTYMTMPICIHWNTAYVLLLIIRDYKHKQNGSIYYKKASTGISPNLKANFIPELRGLTSNIQTFPRYNTYDEYRISLW